MLLHELATEPSNEIDKAEVADRIAANEFGPKYDHKERKSVYVNLVQSHIPQLERNDVIECDRDGTIRFGENARDVLRAFVDITQGHRARPQSRAQPVAQI